MIKSFRLTVSMSRELESSSYDETTNLVIIYLLLHTSAMFNTVTMRLKIRACVTSFLSPYQRGRASDPKSAVSKSLCILTFVDGRE